MMMGAALERFFFWYRSPLKVPRIFVGGRQARRFIREPSNTFFFGGGVGLDRTLFV